MINSKQTRAKKEKEDSNGKMDKINGQKIGF
jgi:hypothetical protein